MLVSRDYPDNYRDTLTGVPTFALAQRIDPE